MHVFYICVYIYMIENVLHIYIYDLNIINS